MVQMANYKKLYLKSFNKITDIINELSEFQQELEEEILTPEGTAIAFKKENHTNNIENTPEKDPST